MQNENPRIHLTSAFLLLTFAFVCHFCIPCALSSSRIASEPLTIRLRISRCLSRNVPAPARPRHAQNSNSILQRSKSLQPESLALTTSLPLLRWPAQRCAG